MTDVERCEDCSSTCPVWCADSDRWNFVTAHMPRGRASILCPGCYVTRWSLLTGLTATWRLVPENIRVPASADCAKACPPPDREPPVFFRGRIIDAGGGQVTMTVDNDVVGYPRTGAHVVVDEVHP